MNEVTYPVSTSFLITSKDSNLFLLLESSERDCTKDWEAVPLKLKLETKKGVSAYYSTCSEHEITLSISANKISFSFWLKYFQVE